MRIPGTQEEAPEKKVDWEAAKGCLAEISREAPDILQQGVIIGGIACWFYRHLLGKAQDPDFKVPALTTEEEKLWLSKDIDFTNFHAQDARELLKEHVVPDARGRLHLRLKDIPLGFAQVGVTFDPESAWRQSWIGTFAWGQTTVQCRILHPIALYREKVALSQHEFVISAASARLEAEGAFEGIEPPAGGTAVAGDFIRSGRARVFFGQLRKTAGGDQWTGGWLGWSFM